MAMESVFVEVLSLLVQIISSYSSFSLELNVCMYPFLDRMSSEGSRDDFLKLNEKIGGMTLPELPPSNATVQAKDTWRTDCARLKFTYIEKSEMIHTFVYYKYQEQKLNARRP
jgi:hypothetical protein